MEPGTIVSRSYAHICKAQRWFHRKPESKCVYWIQKRQKTLFDTERVMIFFFYCSFSCLRHFYSISTDVFISSETRKFINRNTFKTFNILMCTVCILLRFEFHFEIVWLHFDVILCKTHSFNMNKTFTENLMQPMWSFFLFLDVKIQIYWGSINVHTFIVQEYHQFQTA